MLLSLTLLGCQDYAYTVQERTDVFQQDPPDAVDILLVVDNSYSMEPYQERLIDNFSGFIETFVEADVNYQIAVVSTTLGEPVAVGGWPECTSEAIEAMPEDGELSQSTILAPGTPDAERRFAEMVRVGICGSGAEMGLHASYMALGERVQDGTNTGLLRDEAKLSVIYVSDEQDSSPEPVWVYLNELRRLKDPALGRDAVTLSALVALSDDNSCPTEVSPAIGGSRYLEAAELSDGVVANICDDDFSGIVTELGLNASRLRKRFVLSHMPDVGSLEVSLGETALACGEGWQFVLEPDTDGGQGLPTIVFDDHPSSNSTIQVYYRYGTGQEAPCSP